jgi:hypothetical protein
MNRSRSDSFVSSNSSSIMSILASDNLSSSYESNVLLSSFLSLFYFNNNNKFNNFLELKSFNKDILKEIKTVDKSKDLVCLEIRDSIIKLLIELFKEEQNLNLFDSAINYFFASII